MRNEINFSVCIALLVWLLLPAFCWADFQAGQEAFLEEDYETALRELRPIADRGHAEAQYLLGVMYAAGRGAPQDVVKGAGWFRLAAEQGHVIAQYELGLRYGLGLGVREDFSESARWYRLAADQGNVDAQYILGVLYSLGKGVPRDFVVGYMWFDLAAAQGDKIAHEKQRKLAEKMTTVQLADAQRLAREWKAKEE